MRSLAWLAWLVAVLLIVAGLHAVDWSLAAALAFIGTAVLLMAWVVADQKGLKQWDRSKGSSMSLPERLRRIEQQQEEQRQATVRQETRLECFIATLDNLVAALAAESEEEQDAPGTSLDGEPLPCDRDQSQSLG